MFTVYILQSEQDNSYYIGSTSDLENRILEHNYEGTGYTSKKETVESCVF
ncbi:MAG: GIY-YIG nuclease family protein [Candidatus Roizmanbacteria bacterium]|nr:GIY-YIG nuclease family protein [Candidatus Roizmanbacteria bacterium]